MNVSEVFVARILDYVKTQVAPELVEPVTRATAQAIATLMSDPFFTAELRIVSDLRQENQWLKSQVIQLQRVLTASAAMSTGTSASRTTSPRAKRPNTSKKASKASAPRSSTSKGSRTVRVGGNAPRTAKANFVKGVRQAKRR